MAIVQLGGSLELTHSAVDVGTSSSAVIAANPYRQYLLVTNNSGVSVYIKFGVAAAVNEGIHLGPGDSYESSIRHGNLDRRAVYAIHAGTGNKSLHVTEG